MTPPSVADVLAMAGEQILTAARIAWPGAEVTSGPVTPSVTSYVQQVDIDGRRLYAKTSVCGVSLVSVLRGACGDLAAVCARQAAYLVSPGSLMEREAAQLRTLAGPAGLATVSLAGYAHGVLFTEPVTGPTLADLIQTEPDRTRELLALVVRDVAEGLARDGVAEAVGRAPIRERGISGTYQTHGGPGGDLREEDSGRVTLGGEGDGQPACERCRAAFRMATSSTRRPRTATPTSSGFFPRPPTTPPCTRGWLTCPVRGS
ncbi:hypothetical protein [Streptomyces sp. NPDC058671]|uniref:hypothetical protein n=1 Tax=Streptomyces sp. NPDC058671 TaxID=3346590 RepID=UPI0036578708